ncbi:hypothetical protein Hdeb2414_s0008g00268651 [Helianthus debilis subsp. tardiflorus]|nr:hypothetical protein HanLR1_Chr14g0549331 [Helianthus annuus]
MKLIIWLPEAVSFWLICLFERALITVVEGSNCIWMLLGITSGDFFNGNLRPSFLVCFVSLLCS